MPIKKEKMISICILGISVLFYLFWAFYDGVILCPDSASYINMSISREPFYCMFLACLKMLFNYNAYLTVAVYLQSILAALAAYCMADYLRKEFKLTCFQMSLVVSIPLLVSLLCRFVAKQASMYSNCILTEGIACSLFLIFARYLLEFCYRKKWKSLFISSVISFILVSTRKQMCITVFLIICTIFVVYCKNKEIKRGVLISFLCASCIICGSLLLDRGYNYIVHGEAVTHSSDNRFLATMVVYTSERVDGERIQEETARSLFYQIYDTCEEKGYLQKDILGGHNIRVSHFMASYDNIQYKAIRLVIHDYVYTTYEDSEVNMEMRVDEITHQITVGLFPAVWKKVMGCFFDNIISGLVTTVSKENPILTIYSIVIYMLFCVLLIVQVMYKGISKVVAFAVYTMISIIVNVVVVAMVIFCQSRYMIYNMPLFYISLWLLLVRDYDILKAKIKNICKGKER